MKIVNINKKKIFRGDMMPDIDMDFPTDCRDKVKNYIKEKYGYAYTCSIGSYVKMKLKTCIKDFGKIKGLPFDFTNKLTKDIDDQAEYTWGNLIEYATKSKLLFKFVQEYPDIVHLTKFALSQPKSKSIHASAVVIVPKFRVDDKSKSIDLFEWLPVKQIDGLLVSEWEGKYIDKSGFLKEDILGLSLLDKFKCIFTFIKKNTGKTIDVNKITFDDKKVFDYFQKGWCEDIFQFGTSGLMNYCTQVKPDCIEHLIAMSALFRPGPMAINAHNDFADIKNGIKKPDYDFGMIGITKETESLYVYQEQIMKAVVVGGLSEIESDILRTAIKKRQVDVMVSYGEKFRNGYAELLRKNNIDNPKEYAERVWKKLLSFSAYGFNKSHAAAYSIMSYWQQWFKVNYPLEFWTATLQFSKEDEIPYRLAEIKKIGEKIEVRPPDINFSDNGFTCDKKENRIFFSLTKIKGVGEIAVSNIIATRNKGGIFYSLEEFLFRVPSKVNARVIKFLIISGAFDLVENIKSKTERKRLLKNFLETKNADLPEEYKTKESNTSAFWVLEQKKLTGFGELDYKKAIADFLPNKKLAKMYVSDVEFSEAREKKEVLIVGKLIQSREKKIKNGTTMCFLKVECNNTIISVMLFSDIFEKVKNEVYDFSGKIVAISGNIGVDSWKNSKILIGNKTTRLYSLESDNKSNKNNNKI